MANRETLTSAVAGEGAVFFRLTVEHPRVAGRSYSVYLDPLLRSLQD